MRERSSGIDPYLTWCIFSYTSFSFFELNLKRGECQANACMESLYLDSIIWFPWRKTLFGVYVELQSAFFKRVFQM